MHVASTAAADATVPDQRPTLRSRTDRAALPGLIAVLAVTAEVVTRILVKLDGNVSGLALIGDTYGHRGRLPAGTEVFSYGGYDGQFYFRMALAPANLHWSAHGLTMDSWYRFVRIGYPALA